MNAHFDYIICGAGCSGLSLAYRLASEKFSDKKILLIEKEEKNTNDRSWCFWEKEQGLFEPIVDTSWENLTIHAGDFNSTCTILPYRYKMIKSLDFYSFCLEKIKNCQHIKIISATVHSVKSHEKGVSVITGEGIYSADFAFSSILSGDQKWQNSPYVLQHFRGWVLKSEKAIFNPSVANFMDFRIPQDKETRFFYVLPVNANEALVELVVFSGKPWESQYYDFQIIQYLKNYFELGEYEILETENGIIPMTTYPFEQHNSSRCIHIGTAGGMVKASTGFAFDRIQKHSDQIVERLLYGRFTDLKKINSQNRFRWYDEVFLKALTQKKVSAELVYQSLFKLNEIQDVLNFLNETVGWQEEFNILSSLPKWRLIKGALNL